MRVVLTNAEELKLKSPEVIIGEFASICYNTDIEVAHPASIGINCISANHGSPQRAVLFRFYIDGISRVESHQHVRHNTGVAHNQRSQRYVVESESSIVIPKTFADCKATFEINDTEYTAPDIYRLIHDVSLGAYNMLIATGEIPAEDARYLLTQGTETQINSAFTAQALIHFCNERLCTRAQWEIRAVAEAMVAEVAKIDSRIVEYLVPKCHMNALGYCPEKAKDSCGRRPLKSEVFKYYEGRE